MNDEVLYGQGDTCPVQPGVGVVDSVAGVGCATRAEDYFNDAGSVGGSPASVGGVGIGSSPPKPKVKNERLFGKRFGPRS